MTPLISAYQYTEQLWRSASGRATVSTAPTLGKQSAFVVWAVILASLAVALLSHDNRVASRTILFIKRVFAILTGLEEVIAGVILLGVAMGTEIVGYLADVLGRCKVSTGVVLIFAAGALFAAAVADIILLILRLVTSIEPIPSRQFTIIRYASPSSRHPAFPLALILVLAAMRAKYLGRTNQYCTGTVGVLMVRPGSLYPRGG